MAAKAGKRPLRSLNPDEKLDAIRRVHDGESKASVARDIGVPESTLRGWCKNEEKISYLSRQSSPETDESLEHNKRTKLDNPPSMQPFNLSLKSNGAGTYSPNSETRYALDYKKNEGDPTKTHLSINIKNDTPKSTNQMSERERNKAELARLSIELGLNRPEMFLPGLSNPTNNLADLSANIGLLAQWNTLLIQQQSQQIAMSNKSKVPTTTDVTSQMTSTAASVIATMDPEKHKHLPKERQSVQESVWSWLRAQQSMFALTQGHLPNVHTVNGSTSSMSTTSPVVSTNGLKGTPADQSSYPFWKLYKEEGHTHIQPPIQALPTDNIPILYQQLTKDTSPKDVASNVNQQNAENLSRHNDIEKSNNKTATSTSNNKVRSVLDNLLFNNQNVNTKDSKEDDVLSQSEALEHGEKFLKWLETCSDPKITAMQIMQFRSLLNNVRPGIDHKNGDVPNKTKVKRK